MSRLHDYKIQNLSYRTKGEKWYYDNYLMNNGIKRKIKRQTIIGQRICDFTLSSYGIRIEIDGKHHYTSGYKAYDKKRDRIIFERYGWITLRIEDFDDKKASESIEYIKSIKRNHMKRLEFIKRNIRDKNIEDIDREKYSDEGKLVIDYYMSLYKKDIAKIKKEKIIKIKTPRIKKEIIQPPRSYSLGISMFYSGLANRTPE